MKDIRLWGILIVALAVRAVMLQSVFADVNRAQTPDSEDYVGLARGLRSWQYGDSWVPKTAAYLGSPLQYESSSGPEIGRPSAYPAFLAGARIIVPSRFKYEVGHLGSRLISPTPTCWKVVLAFQLLLDLHLVLLTFLLGRALAGHGPGLLAALFQAVSPLAATASCGLLPGSIFAFLLMLAVILLVRHFRTEGWLSLLSGALVLAVACYFQPMGLAYLGVMMLVLACRPKRIRRTAAFAAVAAACMSPWIARNVVEADYFGFSNAGTNCIYWYSAAETVASLQDKPVEEVREQFHAAELWGNFDPGLIGKPVPSDAPRYHAPGRLARYRRQKVCDIILANPWKFLSIHLGGDVAFWLPGAADALELMGYEPQAEGTLDVLHRDGFVASAKHYCGNDTRGVILGAMMVVVVLIRYAGVVLFGLCWLRPKMTSAGWLCLLLVLTAWLLPGPANCPRFRVPVEPILSAAAAIGWLGLLGWRRGQKSGADDDRANDQKRVDQEGDDALQG